MKYILCFSSHLEVAPLTFNPRDFHPFLENRRDSMLHSPSINLHLAFAGAGGFSFRPCHPALGQFAFHIMNGTTTIMQSHGGLGWSTELEVELKQESPGVES